MLVPCVCRRVLVVSFVSGYGNLEGLPRELLGGGEEFRLLPYLVEIFLIVLLLICVTSRAVCFSSVGSVF